MISIWTTIPFKTMEFVFLCITKSTFIEDHKYTILECKMHT